MTPRRKPDRRFGDFELLQRVGRDGPFHLFRARQISLGRPVLLKVLPERSANLERAGLLRREAEAANRLDHPVILRIYEAGDVAGSPYLAFAHIEGTRLAERLAGSAVSPRLSADLARQLAEALAHAHERGVLHGSLRPEMVWLTRDGQVRLAGFGNPVSFEALDTDLVAGFAGYLAPEQAGGRGAVGKATDVYGLGALLFAMLTGAPPHQGPTVAETCRVIRSQSPLRPSRLHPGLAPALDMICLKCLRMSPARRYGGERPLARLIAELRKVRVGRVEPDAWDDIGPWLRRHGRLVRTAALLTLFAAMPACWDRQQRLSAWDVATRSDADLDDYTRAGRHFERHAADQPADAESTAGLVLTRFRTGQPPPSLPQPPAWSLELDDWSAVRKLTKILSDWKQNRRSDAQSGWNAARSSGYTPRSEVAKKLYAECAQLLSSATDVNAR